MLLFGVIIMKPTMLMILDGYGINKDTEGNAHRAGSQAKPR